MIKSHILVLGLLLTASALACDPQECRVILKKELAAKKADEKKVEACKTHEQLNVEEAAKKEQDRIDRMRIRRELIIDKLGLDH